MAQLKEGMKAPDFLLPSNSGKRVSLKDFKNKERVVLYFYPKDDTPGCTKEACGFRDQQKNFRSQNAVVLGVSPDSVDSHNRFIEKFKLPFVLLSDESKEMLQKYSVWKEKSLYGRKYMGVERTTLIIDKTGKIYKIFKKVKVEGHVEEVVEALKTL